MKQYLSWQEFTTKYPRGERFDTDKYSRYIVRALLITQCNIDPNDIWETEGNNCIDLSFKNTKDTIFLTEIKDRFDFSTAYNDHIFESDKWAGIQNRKTKFPNYTVKLVLFSLYTDGVIKISNDLEKDYLEQIKRICPTTTTLEDHRPKNKTLLRFKPAKHIYFAICLDTDTNQWTPIFSDSPIDLRKLNEPKTSELF